MRIIIEGKEINDEDVNIVDSGYKKIKTIEDGKTAVYDFYVSINDLSRYYNGEFFVYLESRDRNLVNKHNKHAGIESGIYNKGEIFDNKKDAYIYANKLITNGVVIEDGEIYLSPDPIIVEENLSAIFSVLEEINSLK